MLVIHTLAKSTRLLGNSTKHCYLIKYRALIMLIYHAAKEEITYRKEIVIKIYYIYDRLKVL